MVSPWFHVGGGAKLLKPELEELRRFAPEVIAGPADALKALATAGDWQQDNCLFAMTALAGVGTPLLSQSARLRLWRAFGVPVYVQLRGFQGELFARECEAHNGLHFDAANVIFQRRPSGELLLTSLGNTRHTVLRLATRLEASIETRICDCGLSSPSHGPSGRHGTRSRTRASLGAIAHGPRRRGERYPRHPGRKTAVALTAEPLKPDAILVLTARSALASGACERGGIGRRTRLRIWLPQGMGVRPPRSHHPHSLPTP